MKCVFSDEIYEYAVCQYFIKQSGGPWFDIFSKITYCPWRVCTQLTSKTDQIGIITSLWARDEFTEYIYSETYNGMVTGVIFLDLMKTVDSVNHHIQCR